MTNSDLNKYGMFKVLIAIYIKWLTIISTIPALAEMFELLKTKVEEIKATSKALKNAKQGNVANKNNSLLAAIEAVLPIKGLLKSYAANSGNEVLLAKVKVTESDLTTKYREDEAIEKLNIIMEEAKNFPDVMSKGNFTTEKLDAVQSLVNNVETAESSVNSGNASASALRKKEAALVKEVSVIIKDHLDELMLLTKKDHIDLYNEYIAAKVIKDLGGKQKQPADEVDIVTPVQSPEQSK